MKTISKFALLMVFTTLLLSSCKTTSYSMREPNVRVELNRADFVLSEQFTADAARTTIFGIDFQRLFNKKTAFVGSSIPVVGVSMKGITSSYALYDLMQGNPGYDVVFYPQYEVKVKKPLGLGIIVRKTEVKVTARLGQFREE